MLKVNNNLIKVNHFPDKTQSIVLDFHIHSGENNITFNWRYENDEEMVTLIFLVNHFKEIYSNKKYILNLGYVPNSRMD